MQVKTTVRYHYKLECLEFERLTIPRVDKDMEELVGMQNSTSTLKNLDSFFRSYTYTYCMI